MHRPIRHGPGPACRLALAAAALAVTLALAGCGGMAGTYEAADGDKIEFKGHKAYITITPAPTMAGEYEIDGDKVILKMSGQSMVLTRHGDTLEGGPFGMKFVKK